jgi:integrase/recombinase XerD
MSTELELWRAEASTLPAVAKIPASVASAGAAATFAWEEFFLATIRNAHTRTAYLQAVRRFLAWCEAQDLELARITPGRVGAYFNALPLAPPSKKLHLAAVRAFFNVLVIRHVVLLNPALSVKTERYSAVEGRTLAIAVEQARRLLASIPTGSLIGLRDRALVGVLVYTTVRESAAASLRLRDFMSDGTQFVLQFAEKGGKARSIPVRHDLQQFLTEYLLAARLNPEPQEGPLFRSMQGQTGKLTRRAMSGVDVYRVVKRRLQAAGLPTLFSPHSFRSCGATDLLSQGVPLEDVQYLLGHADARTTRLYDRRQKQITRNIVERISV